jgi:putative nucleotidyltransferase with HDIG domain
MTTTMRPPSPRCDRASTAEPPLSDPLLVLRGFVGLRHLAGMYPAGHPTIAEKVRDLDDVVQRHLRAVPALRIDILHGNVHLNEVPCRADSEGAEQVLRELVDLGIHSIHIDSGVEPEELRAVGEFLWQMREGIGREPVESELARRRVRHVSLARIVPLDTRWRATNWPDAPEGPLDPAYRESLDLAAQTFESVGAGKRLDVVTVRDLVELLINRVARSSAALAQILAVKQYENLTYCHSVNVAIIGLLLGKRLGFDDSTTAALVEAGLLHDIGKTRVPLEILKKPGALDKQERRTIEAHTRFGAEILVGTQGVRPLTPTVALEHHRSVTGLGYPDLGDGAIPHPLSQIVSVADTYEAITGARSYCAPSLPHQACLILARLAGQRLHTALVKALVSAITFFPIGSLVRTSRDETGVVVRTNSDDPLHPVVTLLDDSLSAARGEVDTAVRDASGRYERHIVETLRVPSDLDVGRLLPADAVVV